MIEIDLKNNLHKVLLFIGIVSIFIFGYYLTPNKSFYDRMLKTRIAENYNGKVLEKYTDSSNHCTPMLKLSDRNISLENTFWNEVHIKDSIVKIKGESFITLYRKDRTKIIFDYEKYFEKLSAKNKPK